MKEFKDCRILIVGGAGFVGSNLTHALLRSAPKEIIVIDNLLSAELSNLPDDLAVSFIEGSITDDKILQNIDDNLSYVFHLATFHGNQSSIHDPLADHENSALSTLKLYETIKTLGKIKKVVYSSAGCTVAAKTLEKAHATKEDDPVSLHLDSPYQISKIMGEFYSNYYYAQYGLPVVKARFQNVYGPREILGAGQWRGTPATVWRNVIPTFVYRAIKKIPLKIMGDGTSTRDFIYVGDVVRGLMLCAQMGEPGEVYNLASGVETSISQLANLINSLIDTPAPIEYVPKRKWDHSGKRFGSTQKANRELGFEAKIGIHEGIGLTIHWTRDNFSIIESCIQKHSVHMEAYEAR